MMTFPMISRNGGFFSLCPRKEALIDAIDLIYWFVEHISSQEYYALLLVIAIRLFLFAQNLVKIL